MSLEGLLLLLLTTSLLANIPVAIILTVAAWQKPRIKVLVVWAVGSWLVAIGIGAYVLAVVNAAFGYLVAPEAAKIVLRLCLLGLAFYPLWWLWLFVTKRFRDGDQKEA